MSGKPVRSSGENPDVLKWMNESAGRSVKDSRREVEVGDPPIKAEQPPTTTKDSLSTATPLPAPPAPALPRPASPPAPDREILLQFRDSTPSNAAEQAKQSNCDDIRSIQSKASSTRKPKASCEIRDDPLDVHQTILRYLKSSVRAPIRTVYELANLITNSCANVFDQYSVPDAF
jgi:hypothetical protein